MILAIDPGAERSGWCQIDETEEPCLPMNSGEADNDGVLTLIHDTAASCAPIFVIEDVVGYGQVVGASTFDTAKWAGRFLQHAVDCGARAEFISRRNVKLHLLGRANGDDRAVRDALAHIYGGEARAFGTGRGKSKVLGLFGDCRGHALSAFAVGKTWLETVLARERRA